MAMVGPFVTAQSRHCAQRSTFSFRIFILEGILTVVVSLVAYFVVPTWSHKAKFVRFCSDDHVTQLTNIPYS